MVEELDNASNEGRGFVTNQTDPGNPQAEYGPSDFDTALHHAFGTWTRPDPNSNGLMKDVLGGWQANGIFTWHTGYPWTPVIGVTFRRAGERRFSDCAHAADAVWDLERRRAGPR